MEREKPFLPLLHRELHTHDVNEHFGAQLDLCRDLVSYGTNLIVSCFHSSDRQLGDVILLTVWLKQVVAMLDAFEVLVTNACISASQLQSRAMFEASVNIDFGLMGRLEEKAQYFYVSNVRRELKWAQVSRTDSPERGRFFESLGEFGQSLRGVPPETDQTIKTQIQAANEFLAKDPWSLVNSNLEKAKGKRKYDVAWYVPFGSGSIRDLCRLTGRLHEYEVFYGAASEKMHSSEYKSHISFGSGRISFHPIRSLEGIRSTLHWSLSIAFHSYRAVLQRYRPGQLDEFARRYIAHWRDSYLNIKNIVYAVKQDDASPI